MKRFSGLVSSLVLMAIAGCGTSQPTATQTSASKSAYIAITGSEPVNISDDPLAPPLSTPAAAASETAAADNSSPRKIERAREEVRQPAPSEPGGSGRNMASELINQAFLSYVVQTEEGRSPLHENSPVSNGALITRHRTGQRCRFVLPGKSIEPGKPEWDAWRVDGRPVTLVNIPQDEDLPRLGAESRLAQQRDELILDFEKNFGMGLIPLSQITLKLTSTESALGWEMAAHSEEGPAGKAGIARFALAVVPLRRQILVIASPTRDHDDDGAGTLVKSIVASMERLEDLPPHEAPLTVEDLEKTGLTLRQALRLSRGMLGLDYGALLNDDLAASRDRDIEGVIALSPQKCVACLRILSLLSHDHRAQVAGQQVTADRPDPADRLGLLDEAGGLTVFDGQSAHTVNPVGFDARSRGFIYWEPWAKGSFLEKDNNQADIEARPFDRRNKYFTVTFAELESVLYSLQVERPQLEMLQQLVGWFDLPLAELREAVQSVRSANPEARAIQPRTLLAVGHSFLMSEQPEAAARFFTICRELDPTSADAVHGLALVAAARHCADRQ